MLTKSLLAAITTLFLTFTYLHFGHNWQELPSTPPKTSKIKTSPVRYIANIPTEKTSVGSFEKEKLVETYLDSSGLWAQLSLPAKILNRHLDSPKILKKISRQELEEIRQLIGEKLGVDTISRKVKIQFLSSFSPAELEKLIEIYSSPTMKKVASLEEYLSSEDALMKASLIEMNAKKGSERAKLFSRLEAVKNDGERSFQITLHSIKGLHQGFNRVLPREKRVPENKVKNTITILNKFARPNFKNLALIRYDYAYKELSAKELKEYISISGSKLMQKAQDATLKGILNSFKEL